MKPVLSLIASSLILASCAPSLSLIGGDPSQSSAKVAAVEYRTPFSRFVKYDLVEPRPWRETNDRVRDLNGPDAQMQADSEDDPIPGAKR